MNEIWWLLVVINGQASVSDPLTLEECLTPAIMLKHHPDVMYADCFKLSERPVPPKEKEPPKRPFPREQDT